MTREEAIRRIETHIAYHRSGDYGFFKTDEALEMAVSALRKQEELSKAESEGRVIVLPCKVGDTVYQVHNNTDACATCLHYSSWFGTDVLCDSPNLRVDEHDYPNLAKRPICEKQFMEVVEYQPNIESIFYHRNEFGKTIFLTRKEAEGALHGLEEV